MQYGECLLIEKKSLTTPSQIIQMLPGQSLPMPCQIFEIFSETPSLVISRPSSLTCCQSLQIISLQWCPARSSISDSPPTPSQVFSQPSPLSCDWPPALHSCRRPCTLHSSVPPVQCLQPSKQLHLHRVSPKSVQAVPQNRPVSFAVFSVAGLLVVL